MARKLSIKVYSDGAVLETMLKDLNSVSKIIDNEDSKFWFGIGIYH